MQELRALASGLQPAALAGGGLRAAIEELAGRIPLRSPGRRRATQRYPPTLESAAWFVVAEGVANAVKHARRRRGRPSRAHQSGARAAWSPSPTTGSGGADPHGHGLQGLADRVAALGRRLSVSSRTTGGTTLEAVFPCGS